MKLLAWDTSTKSGSIAALEWTDRKDCRWKDVRLVAEMTLNVNAGVHSEGLLWGIHECLSSAQWKLDDLDLFGVGVGPGSFTGLRIGLATARTLGQTLEKPIVGVSSLCALVRPLSFHYAAKEDSDPWIVGATDACKGELFVTWGKASDFRRQAYEKKVQEAVLTPESFIEAFLKDMKASKEKEWIALGEGTERYPESWALLPQNKRLKSLPDVTPRIQGRYLAQLAWEGFRAGRARPALEIYPRYLRSSDAEIKLKKGLLPLF
ncbi:MAG: tRNA (adenosine(37)-N6)-threonylcarbamoyltransferase complex dimerization subunit type 1 TsaB [Bdellovibrio sp.]|nr:tRNA (adenosine(37)-N6)-threonylcarbamoyltransferase complex dimerization subunit type 1 TsaB [Bdellovibrio sp.]